MRDVGQACDDRRLSLSCQFSCQSAERLVSGRIREEEGICGCVQQRERERFSIGRNEGCLSQLRAETQSPAKSKVLRAVQLPVLPGLLFRQFNYQQGFPASFAPIKTSRLALLIASLAYYTKNKNNLWLHSIWRSASNSLHHSEDHGKPPQLPSVYTWDPRWLHTLLLI